MTHLNPLYKTKFSVCKIVLFSNKRNIIKFVLFLGLLLLHNLCYSQQKTPTYAPPPPASYYAVSNGNYDFVIPYGFTRYDVTKDISDAFKPLFDVYNMPMPKNLYMLPKSDSNVILVMFGKTKLDYNVGKNENLTKEQMESMIAELSPYAKKGNLEYYKMNDVNAIKHTYLSGSMQVTMYYVYDLDELLITLVSSAGDLKEWNLKEVKIMNSFKRKQILNSRKSYNFFNILVELDNNTSFSYGKDAVTQMSEIFKGFDDLAKKANIDEHINSDKLSKSATIYNASIGSLMIFAKDLEFPFKNSEMINDDESIVILKNMLDDDVENEIPKNIDVIKSKKAEKYLSPNGVLYIIKEVVAKKTNLVNHKISFDTSVFINLLHSNKLYTIHGSYKDDKEKQFIYETIDNINLK